MIINSIEHMLSKQYDCSLNELHGKNTIYTICENTKQNYLKILAYQNCIVICTSKNLQNRIKNILQYKNKDEIFENPFVYGQTIHYVPNDIHCNILLPENYKIEFVFGESIKQIENHFQNALYIDQYGNTTTKVICIAKQHGKVIAVAGASETNFDNIYEIGIDVMEQHRGKGIASYLVNELTKKCIAKNIVPFYSASVTNIASQMVANKCHYIPLWIDTFGTILDGSSVYHDMLSEFISKFFIQ